MKVTQLERDLWVHAYAFSSAWGKVPSSAEYWAAEAVMSFRSRGDTRPEVSKQAVTQIREAVEAFDKEKNG